MKLKIKMLMGAVVLLAGLVSIAWGKTEDVDKIKVGDQVPHYSLTDGDRQITAESLKGKVVLINFFATWCPPCVKELPHLQEKVWEHNKNNEDFVLLVVGRQHSPEEVAAFAGKRDLDLPFYADPKREMFDLFATQNIPRNFIVNRDGKVIYSSSGFNEAEFQEMIELLTSELDK